MDTTDAYTVLGLAPHASLEEAEDAYRRLMRRHHPDLHQGGTADQLAAAERRTVELNAAIRLMRANHAQAAVGQPAGADGAPAKATTFFQSATAPPAEPGYWWDGEPDEAPPMVACPLCGAWFTTAATLKVHAGEQHEMRLGARQRRAKRARQRHRSLPLWVIVPVNAIVALVAAATADALGRDLALSGWVFALAMAPSAIRLFTNDPV